MLISVLLDRSRQESLTTQIVDQIREAIRCMRIGPGTRLPSSRQLSEQLAISRNTVVRAYDLLLLEGIVRSRPASGIYVAEQLPRSTTPMHRASDPPDLALQTRTPMPLRYRRAQESLHAVRNRLLYDFFPGRHSAELFPLKRRGAHADIRPPRSVPSGIADDADRRPDPRGDPLHADRVGTRLPSSRQLSEQLAISRNTVVRAYDLLLMEGIVKSRPASGIYVAEQLPRSTAPVHRFPILPILRCGRACRCRSVTGASRDRCTPSATGCSMISFQVATARSCFR